MSTNCSYEVMADAMLGMALWDRIKMTDWGRPVLAQHKVDLDQSASKCSCGSGYRFSECPTIVRAIKILAGIS